MKPITRAVSLAFLSSLIAAIVLVGGCTLSEVKRAEQLAKAGNWDGAVEAYRQAAKKEPFDPAIQTALEQAKARAVSTKARRAQGLLAPNVNSS